MSHEKHNNGGSGMGIGFAIGIALGMLLAIATGHHTYIAFGIAIGAGCGTAFENTERGERTLMAAFKRNKEK